MDLHHRIDSEQAKTFRASVELLRGETIVIHYEERSDLLRRHG